MPTDPNDADRLKKGTSSDSPCTDPAPQTRSEKARPVQDMYNRFITAYYKTFSNNIAAFIKESSVNDSQKLNSDEFYPFMFAFILNNNLRNEIKSYFQDLIHHTYEAEKILSRAWLVMIKDFANYMIEHKKTIDNMNVLTNRIHELSTILSETYLSFSKRVTINKPDVNNNDPSYQKLLQTFKNYIDKDNQEEGDYELKIHTYYRGIPVDLDAKVLLVDSGSVTFSIHPYEAVALSKFGMAFISSSIHGTAFKAYTRDVDIIKRTATFTHFVSHDHLNERRSFVRVEPCRNIKAKLINDLNEVNGTLYDLSEISVSIYLRNINIDRFQQDQPVQLITNLPNVFEKKSTLINTPCKIMKVYKQTKGDPNAHRVVVKLEDDHNLKSRLIEYICQRQSEILHELKTLSQNKE